MALLDRVFFLASTTGTADFTVGSAVNGALTPVQAGAQNGVTYQYVAVDPNNISNWEIGIGTSQNNTWFVDAANVQMSVGVVPNTTSTSVTAPPGIAAGDLLAMLITVGNGGNYAAGTITLPAGWTQADTADLTDNGNPSFSGARNVVAYKIAGNSEPASYTVSWQNSLSFNQWAIVIARARAINGGVTFDQVQQYANSSDTGPSYNFPALSGLSTSNDLALYFSSNTQNSNIVSFDAALTQIANEPAGIPFDGGFGSTFAAYHVATSANEPSHSLVMASVPVGTYLASIAFSQTQGAVFQRTTVIASSNGGSKVNFSNPPQIAITPVAGLDFGNSPPVTVTGSTYTVDSGSISGTVGVDTDIICNNASGVTLTLPNPAAYPGRKIFVDTIANGAVISASANVVPLGGGAASVSILSALAGQWAILQSISTAWQVMAGGDVIENLPVSANQVFAGPATSINPVPSWRGYATDSSSGTTSTVSINIGTAPVYVIVFIQFQASVTAPVLTVGGQSVPAVVHHSTNYWGFAGPISGISGSQNVSVTAPGTGFTERDFFVWSCSNAAQIIAVANGGTPTLNTENGGIVLAYCDMTAFTGFTEQHTGTVFGPTTGYTADWINQTGSPFTVTGGSTDLVAISIGAPAVPGAYRKLVQADIPFLGTNTAQELNSPPVTIATSTYTVDSGSVPDTDLIFNDAAGVTVTLPTATGSGRKINIKTIAAGAIISASSNVVPLAGGAAGTSILAATAGKYCTLQDDPTTTAWVIMAAN